MPASLAPAAHPGRLPAGLRGQRRALLAGLLDTDGTVAPTRRRAASPTADRALADDVHELVVSLGYRAPSRRQAVDGRRSAPVDASRPTTTSSGSSRKRLRAQGARRGRRRRSGSRFIVDVRPVPSVPVRCVEVDNADHLYLAGRSMIPTHNSTLGLDFARSASIKHNMPARSSRWK